MRVHFFNTYLQGGAAYGAINLFEHLREDIDGVFFYMRDLSGGPKLEKLFNASAYGQKHPIQQNNLLSRFPNSVKARLHYQTLASHLKGRNGNYEQFSPAWQYYSSPYTWFNKQLPDIIHLHWIAEWLDYSSFFKSIPNNLPIVWTLHDMNPFTGGCHYSWDCEKYKASCYQCPQLGTMAKGDLAKKNWQTKLKALKGKNLHIVGDSQWITEEAKQSPLFADVKSFQTIHYSIDFSVFKPFSNNVTIRKRFGIPSDAFILCFGAADFTNRRKGFYELLQALRYIGQDRNIHCLVFGAGKIEVDLSSIPPLHFTGNLTPQQLAEIYSASDLFVIPSLDEAFGLTAIESMACGTPVIGFNTGGIPDSVAGGTSGWLVDKGDSKALADRIIELSIKPKEIESIGSKALFFVREKFSKEKETNAYINLYKKINTQTFA